MEKLITLLYSVWVLAAGSAGYGLPPQVPIICYHNIKTSMEGHLPDYTVDQQSFRQQMKTLSDSGYHTITPEALYLYLTKGTTLPPRPIMITFDDNHEEHYSFAAPILKQYGFTGVFFIMTVTIGKPGYMNAAQIKSLSDEGHIIAAHTWDHPDLRHLAPGQWHQELDLPQQTLEKITGKPVRYFAYPFGAWNDTVVRQLKQRNMEAAFQLAEKQSDTDPLYTIRRILVPGNFTPARMLENIRNDFRR